MTPCRPCCVRGWSFRNLSLSAPRQFGFVLDRLSSEQLKWKLDISGLDDLRRSIDDAANRRAFSTVVGALIIGAAIVSTGQQTSEGQILSAILFAAASFFRAVAGVEYSAFRALAVEVYNKTRPDRGWCDQGGDETS